MEGFRYYSQLFSNVTSEYNSDNILKFDINMISPSNYNFGVFLVIFNTSYSFEECNPRSSMYIIILGEENNSTNIKHLNLYKSHDTAPSLIKTSSGYSAVIWGNNDTVYGNVRANIIKLR